MTTVLSRIFVPVSANSILVAGEAECVGIQYFKATKDHPPLRIFYPAVDDDSCNSKSVGWFEEHGTAAYILGQIYVMLGENCKHYLWILWIISHIISFFLPMGWIHIPGVKKGAPYLDSSSESTQLLSSSCSSKNQQLLPQEPPQQQQPQEPQQPQQPQQPQPPQQQPTQQQQQQLSQQRRESQQQQQRQRRRRRRRPVILFSHGRGTTGEENSVLHAAWAKQGYIVVSIHHTDGSSCYVQLADGSIKYYEHDPPPSKYDPMFRPKLVEQRAKEMFQACQFLSSEECPKEIREDIDRDRMVGAGYSLGATTVAKALTMVKDASSSSSSPSSLSSSSSPLPPLSSSLLSSPFHFCAAVMLDGWFYMETSSGMELECPKEAFDIPGGLRTIVPNLYISSETFRRRTKHYKATCKLACGSETHVLQGTAHHNFTDVVFWHPSYLLDLMYYGQQTYTTVPVNHRVMTHREIVQRSSEFMKRVIWKNDDDR